MLCRKSKDEMHLSLSLALFRLIVSKPSTTIYVTPTKSLTSNLELGTIDAPFTSLEAARDLLRSGYGQRTRREVLLRGGNYHLPRPFTLDERDAGTAEFPIIYAAYPGESPHLSGGVLVPPNLFVRTSVPSGATNAFVADLFSLKGVNTSSLGRMGHPYISQKLEVFYGGQPMTLARDPNVGTDSLRTWKWAGYENMTVADSTETPGIRMRRGSGREIDCSDSADTMQCYLDSLADVPELRSREGTSHTFGSNMTFTFKDTDRGAFWASALSEAASRNETAAMWLHGYWKFDWRDTYIQVASISANKASDPNSESVSSYSVTRAADTPPQYPWVSGCRFYAVNSLGLLDAPGEYFVSDSGKLWFIPPDTDTDVLKPVVVSIAEHVVAASGAHHTHFVGLGVSDAQGTVMQLSDAVGAVVSNCTVSNGSVVLFWYFRCVYVPLCVSCLWPMRILFVANVYPFCGQCVSCIYYRFGIPVAYLCTTTGLGLASRCQAPLVPRSTDRQCLVAARRVFWCRAGIPRSVCG